MAWLDFIVQSLLWAVLWLVPNVVAVGVTYYLLSLPLRRQERARFFLDLLATTLERGMTPESGIVAVSQTRDRAMGARFHWLAARIESGETLQRAMSQVPGFLPARILGLLQTGLTLGDVRRVLPACRRLTSDAVSAVEGATNYVILVLMALSPLGAATIGFLSIFVLPKFEMIFMDMGISMPEMLRWLSRNSAWVMVLMLTLCAFVYGLAFLYVAGHYVARWLRSRGVLWVDTLAWALPWKRCRFKRDFGALLSWLLDGGVGEVEAVKHAAASVGNPVLQRRSRQVLEALEQGQSLAEALRRLDASGEFAWRLRNASASSGGFRAALGGWLEALDARAFQQEQLAAQWVTTALVLVHGAVVGLIVVAVYRPLIAVIESAALW